jgi:hypothetical protein
MFDIMPQAVLLSIVPQDARPNTPERSYHRDLSRREAGGRIQNHPAVGARDRKDIGLEELLGLADEVIE